MTIPRCPQCNRKGVQAGPDLYKCPTHGLFDSDPNEGGSHSNDPTKRIEREDEIRAAKQTNLGRRELAASGFRMGRR